MTRLLLRLRNELGLPGRAALVLLAAVAAFHFTLVRPLEARDGALKAQSPRQAPRAAGSAGAPEQVGAVYELLSKEAAPTDWLARLHGIGTATGVHMKSATYRTQATEAPIVRYEVVLPVTGSYGQIRDFLGRALAEVPQMSLDQLSLKRETRKDGALQAELRLTLHMVKS